MGKILVIKTDTLFPNGIDTGFIKVKKVKTFGLINKYSEFLERNEVEDNENYQQIIPQIVLQVRNKIFIHKITQKSNENRLVGLYPIFLGGHVDEGDMSIEEAATREFEEEIDYKGKILHKNFQGLLKLHDTEVNRVHVGLVWIYQGDNFLWRHRDEDLIDGKFVLIKDLHKYKNKMTYWSKLYLTELEKLYI